MGASRVGRSLETGAFLAVLTTTLVVTGLLLSPTVTTSLGLPRGGNALYSAHLAAAALLVGFLAVHLWPMTKALARKVGQSLPSWAASWSLLLLVLLEVATGYVLWARDYRLLGKAPAVGLHLVATFALLVPFAFHAVRGWRVFTARRAAERAAAAAASAAGKGDAARLKHEAITRRAFVRLAAYAAGGLALASIIGRKVSDTITAWRVNSIGRTPRISKDEWRLAITGLVANPVVLTYEDVVALGVESRRFTHHCVEGWTYTDTFDGVPLRKVMALAGGTTSGARMMVFKSAEVGYNGEPYVTNFPVEDPIPDDHLLVIGVAGGELPAIHGAPVRLMSPAKWGYKACKWLVEIQIMDDPAFRGYWERRGYHNRGDLDGPIFG